MGNEKRETGKTNSYRNTGRFLRPAFRVLHLAWTQRGRCVLPARLVFCLLLMVGGVLVTRPAAADTTDETDTHAGIVIQYDDGSLGEYCIDLGADGTATGEEALRATGLDVIVEYQGMGAAVCKIEGDGCDFPADSCFCECSMLPGDPCTYWAYHRLQGGAWVQSPIGASGTNVMGGSVEGWSWGTGTISQGTAPPLRTFEQVCAAILATATPTVAPPTHTATPTPTNTATATTRPSATATTAPTTTPAPTGTLIPVATDTVPTPTGVPPSATIAATNATLPTNTRVVPTVTATNPPPPATEGANGTVTPLPPSPQVEATGTAIPTPDSSEGEGETRTATPVPPPITEGEITALPTLAAPAVNAPTPTVIMGIALQPTMGPAGTSVPPPLVAADADEGGGDMWLYAVFGVIVVGLVGVMGWVWYQQRGN
jgi:hypothetical protein